jgi:hypothetical protein
MLTPTAEECARGLSPPSCAGLDVHKGRVPAALRVAAPGRLRSGLRRFDTSARGLLALGGCLVERGGAAMMPTGVSGRPPIRHTPPGGDLAPSWANLAHVTELPMPPGLRGRASCWARRPEARGPCRARASGWLGSGPFMPTGSGRCWGANPKVGRMPGKVPVSTVRPW